MKYFTISELIRSNTAAKLGIKNEPTMQQRQNLKLLIENVLDPIRQQWGAPIIVNSGFRTPYLNKIVGGVRTSQHMQGKAADIRPLKGNIVTLFQKINWNTIPFDQLIIYKTFIHISYDPTRNRHQFIV